MLYKRKVAPFIVVTTKSNLIFFCAKIDQNRRTRTYSPKHHHGPHPSASFPMRVQVDGQVLCTGGHSVCPCARGQVSLRAPIDYYSMKQKLPWSCALISKCFSKSSLFAPIPVKATVPPLTKLKQKLKRAAEWWEFLIFFFGSERATDHMPPGWNVAPGIGFPWSVPPSYCESAPAPILGR
jgi:hypothetical protein